MQLRLPKGGIVHAGLSHRVRWSDPARHSAAARLGGGGTGAGRGALGALSSCRAQGPGSGWGLGAGKESPSHVKLAPETGPRPRGEPGDCPPHVAGHGMGGGDLPSKVVSLHSCRSAYGAGVLETGHVEPLLQWAGPVLASRRPEGAFLRAFRREGLSHSGWTFRTTSRPEAFLPGAGGGGGPQARRRAADLGLGPGASEHLQIPA